MKQERIEDMTTQTTNRWRFRKQTRPYGESAETGYNALIVAIIKQAVDDYKLAENKLKNPPKFSTKEEQAAYNVKWRDEQRKLVRFFRSNWYATLCDIPCETILKHLGVKA